MTIKLEAIFSMVVISVDIPAVDGRLSEPKQPVVRPECRIAPGNHRFDTARIRPGLPSMVLQSAVGPRDILYICISQANSVSGRVYLHFLSMDGQQRIWQSHK